MNGAKVREFDAIFEGPGSVAVFSLTNGGRVEFKDGDEAHFVEDEFGNTYVYDDDGREFYVNVSSRWRVL